MALKALPALGGERREPQVYREDDRQKKGQPRGIDGRNNEDGHHRHERGKEAVRERFGEVNNFSDRAVQAGGDRARQFRIEVALREREELFVVAHRKDGAHLLAHDIAVVAADRGGDGGEHIHEEEGAGQPQNRRDGGRAGRGAGCG